MSRPPRPPARPSVAKARRAPPLAPAGGDALTRHAEEALFRLAEVLLEGGTQRTQEREVFFGSVMLAVSFDALAAEIRGLDSRRARAAFARCVDGSVRVRLRAMRIASSEVARRHPGRALGTASVETRVRLADDELHIDVDVEVPFEVCSRRGTGD